MKTRPDRWLVAACLFCIAQPAAFATGFEPQADTKARVLVTPTVRASAPFDSEEAPSDDAETSNVAAKAVDLPMCFETNVGQVDERVSFLTRASGLGAFLTPDELMLSLHRSQPADPERAPEELDAASAKPSPAEHLAPAVVRMRLVGASPSAPVGEEQLETRTNYLLGNDPALWHTDVPNFARVRYPEVYPGVDLVYSGSHGNLEFDFVVAPGADPSGVSLEWDGADAIDVDGTGALVMKVDGGELRQLAPVLYQEDESGKRPVAGRFESLGGGRFGVRVGAYDAAKPLVVDPTLVYSTYFGGSDTNVVLDVATTSDGTTYLTGYTWANDFPIRHAFDSTIESTDDAFVTRLNASGTAISYSSYLGGDSADFGYSIAVAPDGTAYVGGVTFSTDFPTTPWYDATMSATNGTDGFVTSLAPNGGSLIASTYLGGGSEVWVRGVAIGPNGDAFVAGTVWGGAFPTTTGAVDRTFAGSTEAFLTRLRMTQLLPFQHYIVYSTFLGGESTDCGNALAVDASGVATVVGFTWSSDFAHYRGFDTTPDGLCDGYVTRIGAAGDAVLNATLIGGANSDGVDAITTDSAGAFYVLGKTASLNFPATATAFDRKYNGGYYDDFVAKLHVGLVSGAPTLLLDYATYLGGNGDEAEYGTSGIAVDSSGEACVAGVTDSTNFPVVNAYDATANGGRDAFVAKLDATGSTLVYSTYLGGSGSDEAHGIGVDASGAVVVAGETDSADFPLMSSLDGTFNGAFRDAFVVKMQ